MAPASAQLTLTPAQEREDNKSQEQAAKAEIKSTGNKSIGLQAILNGNAANKLGGSRSADLTAPQTSVPGLYERIAQNKAQTSSPKGGREGLILQELHTER